MGVQWTNLINRVLILQLLYETNEKKVQVSVKFPSCVITCVYLCAIVFPPCVFSLCAPCTLCQFQHFYSDSL